MVVIYGDDGEKKRRKDGISLVSVYNAKKMSSRVEMGC
jgi:hypothetical protein